jgi:hypothetical protein
VTLVNGQEVLAAELRPGDRIQIGGFEIDVLETVAGPSLEAAPQATPAEPAELACERSTESLRQSSAATTGDPSSSSQGTAGTDHPPGGLPSEVLAPNAVPTATENAHSVCPGADNDGLQSPPSAAADETQSVPTGSVPMEQATAGEAQATPDSQAGNATDATGSTGELPQPEAEALAGDEHGISQNDSSVAAQARQVRDIEPAGDAPFAPSEAEPETCEERTESADSPEPGPPADRFSASPQRVPAEVPAGCDLAAGDSVSDHLPVGGLPGGDSPRLEAVWQATASEPFEVQQVLAEAVSGDYCTVVQTAAGPVGTGSAEKTAGEGQPTEASSTLADSEVRWDAALVGRFAELESALARLETAYSHQATSFERLAGRVDAEFHTSHEALRLELDRTDEVRRRLATLEDRSRQGLQALGEHLNATRRELASLSQGTDRLRSALFAFQASVENRLQNPGQAVAAAQHQESTLEVQTLLAGFAGELASALDQLRAERDWLHKEATQWHAEREKLQTAILARCDLLDERLSTLDTRCQLLLQHKTHGRAEASELDSRLAELRAQREAVENERRRTPRVLLVDEVAAPEAATTSEQPNAMPATGTAIPDVALAEAAEISEPPAAPHEAREVVFADEMVDVAQDPAAAATPAEDFQPTWQIPSEGVDLFRDDERPAPAGQGSPWPSAERLPEQGAPSELSLAAERDWLCDVNAAAGSLDPPAWPLERSTEAAGEGGQGSAPSPVAGEAYEQPQAVSEGRAPRLADEDDDESIESYMAKLMARVKGLIVEPEASPPAYHPPTSASSSAAASSSALAVAMAAPDAEQPANSCEELVVAEAVRAVELEPASRPRSSGVITDLSAMRDLANSNARQAITTHERRRLSSRLHGKLIVTVFAMICSFLLIWFASYGGWLAYMSAVFALLVAAIWGIHYLVLTGQLFAKPDAGAPKADDTPPAESAAQEAPPA